ncbi:MAG TPA: hypothetical protein DEB39_03315 [Planctomycetaceae bacterium]|nr:hypothetical protein [Planctomycetaceae bacterium]
MRVFAFFTVACMILATSFIGAQESGPVVTDSSRDAVVVAGPKTKIDRGGPIDLTKTPWLVESVNVPAGSPIFNRERLLWADPIAFLPNTEAVGPEIVVEKWVNEAPKHEELAGKYLFVEVWATWCPPCRRSLPLLNHYQEKFGDQLVVVAICEAAKNKEGASLDLDGTLTSIKNLANIEGTVKPEDVKFHLAVDTGRRFANKLGVFGIPHAVLIEPTEGVVVWEGMPTWIGYELDDVTLGKYLAIGAKQKAVGKIPEKPPVVFSVQPVGPDDRNERPKAQVKYEGERCGGE